MLTFFIYLCLFFNIITPVKTNITLEKLSQLVTHQPNSAISYLDKTNSIISDTAPNNFSITDSHATCLPVTDKSIIASSSSKASSNTSLINFLSSSNGIQTSNIYKYNLALIMACFFVFGLLLAFTPCVFPMLPILLTIISRKSTTTRKSFILALSYVLGNAVSYAIAGILAAQFGSTLQSIFQNIVVNILIIILFVVFSLSLFGLFELHLPNALNNKLSSNINININNNITNHHKNNMFSLIGAFVAGALSALVLSPCVTAPLAGALLYISYTGNLLIGGASLFMLGLGSGLPLLCIAVFGNKILPKSGKWMDRIKSGLGYLMLLMAIYIASRILNNNWINLMLGLLIIIFTTHTAVTIIKLFKTKICTSAKLFIAASYLLIFGCCLIYLFIPAYTALYRLYRHPIIQNKYQNSTQQLPEQLKFQIVKTTSELNKILSMARNNTPVILDFSAQWCLACKELDMTTFRNPKIITLLKSYTKVRVDITDNNSETKALQKKYAVFAPPSLVFINQNGEVISDAAVTGYITADNLYKILTQIQITTIPTATPKSFNF
ncbi:MAG: thioredoxin:protein disulfide reductase [Pseudomonadota bacterium]|nr:thioredoxin:protein disulfide reductase [Pseudomonadota bacterium]